MSEPLDHDKIIKAAQSLGHEQPKPGFHERFWKKFDHSLVSPPKFGSPSFAWSPMAAAVPVLVAVTTFLVFQIKDVPQAQFFGGQAATMTFDGRQGTLEPGHKIKEGSVLTTDASSWFVFELDKGYRIKINPDSEVTIKKLKRSFWPDKAIFELKKGEVLVSIGDQIARKYPVEIRSAFGFARAMGTQFSVSIPTNAAAQAHVRVLHGTVKTDHLLIHGGQGADLAAKALSRAEPLERNLLKNLEEEFQFSRNNRAVLLIGRGTDRERAKDLLRPCAIYIHLESTAPMAQTLLDVVNKLNLSLDNQDNEGSYQAITSLEKITLTQNEVEKGPLLLFVGASYASSGYVAEALRIFEYVTLQYPSSSYGELAKTAESILREEGSSSA